MVDYSITYTDVIGTDLGEIFKGYKGNNAYFGAKGNDTFNDYSGSDTYFYKLNDGNDTILDSDGNDKIIFDENINKSDLSFEKYNNNLHINIKTTGEMINIIDWFRLDYCKIEILQFFNGDILTSQDIDAIINGTSTPPTDPPPVTPPTDPPTDPPPVIPPADTSNSLIPVNAIIGTELGETFKGYKGDNFYAGEKGNDIFNDYSGSDSYFYSPYDGNDTILDSDGNDKIIFDEGINKSDLIFEQTGSNLHINIKTTSEMINIVNWFKYDFCKIETLLFNDGRTLSSQDVAAIMNGTYIDPDPPTPKIPDSAVIGTDNYDYISGKAGHNFYYAKHDNDLIKDGWGNDTYLYMPGDGQDAIKDTGGFDTILFGGKAIVDDFNFFRSNDNLEICHKHNSDKIDCLNWFQDAYKIEKIVFADGNELGVDDILARLSPMKVRVGTTGDDIIRGGGTGYVLWGIEGNDSIYGGLGNDIIYGGSGNDTLYGYGGNDTIFGETGSDLLYGGSGNTVYEGYNARSFGLDVIDDSKGEDYINFTGFAQSKAIFTCYDNDADGNFDALKIRIDSYNQVDILKYFDDSTNDITALKAGTGCIETIHFDTGDLAFADILNVVHV